MTTSADDSPTTRAATNLGMISAQVYREDIKEINQKLDGLMAFRWTISGGLALIAFFGLSICTFVGWSLWDDNSRILTAETSEKGLTERLNQASLVVDDYNKWRANVNQKIQTLDDKQTLHGWNK